MTDAAVVEAPRDALELHEAIELGETALQADGSILTHLLRPCIGRGKGRHVYEASMLQANASKLTGWKMYLDHQSPQAKRAAGGLPRSVRDLGGRVVESWWDPTIPAEGRFGQGAVMGRVRPVPFVREMAEHDPQLLEVSINATATGVRPVMREGARAWLVEGLEPSGSVDWVTEAGAGGRVIEVMEAAYATAEDEEMALLESMTDEEVLGYFAEHRPSLIEVASGKKQSSDGGDGDAEDAADHGADEEDELIKKYMKKGLPRPLAEKAAKRMLASSATEGAEGDAVATPQELLQEALSTEEGINALREALAESGIVSDLVEVGIAAERDSIRSETRVDSERQIELRDFRDEAHRMIREAKLPEAFEAEALAAFDITESGPTGTLDVWEDVDEEGTITRSAQEKLREAVEKEIEHHRKLVASIKRRPTRVRGQGPTQLTEATDKGETKDTSGAGPDRVGVLTASLLQEAGFRDPDKVYAER